MAPDPKPRKSEYCKRGHPLSEAYVSKDGRRHCRKCHAINNAGSKARNREKNRLYDAEYKATPVTVTCPDCGKQRTITQGVASGLVRKRCLPCAQRRTGDKALSARKMLVCPNCQNEFFRSPSYIKTNSGSTLYCSVACRKDGGGFEEMARRLSKARGGDGNPSFRHGRRVGVHIPGWRLRLKGEYVCRVCGSRDRLQLHHAIPRSKWRGGIADLRNALPLCGDCHSGWHYHKKTIYRDVFTEEEWDFLSNAVLTGQRIEAWLDDHYPIPPPRHGITSHWPDG